MKTQEDHCFNSLTHQFVSSHLEKWHQPWRQTLLTVETHASSTPSQHHIMRWRCFGECAITGRVLYVLYFLGIGTFFSKRYIYSYICIVINMRIRWMLNSKMKIAYLLIINIIIAAVGENLPRKYKFPLYLEKMKWQINAYRSIPTYKLWQVWRSCVMPTCAATHRPRQTSWAGPKRIKCITIYEIRYVIFVSHRAPDRTWLGHQTGIWFTSHVGGWWFFDEYLRKSR